MIENYIPFDDVMIKIKFHPDITKEDKERYKESLKGLFMTDKRKEQTFKKVKSNQQRTYERTTNDNDRIC
jgi:hypothetical protein